MSVIRPVGHEERLSLVEHLDELRSRLITCIAVFLVAFSVCYWQNGWLLETVNKPLQTAQKAGGEEHTQDPLEESARFQIRSGRAFDATAAALASVDKVLARAAARSGLS